MVRDELKSLNNSTSKIKGPSTKYMSMRMKFLQKQREKSVDSDCKSNCVKNPNLSASYNSNVFTTSLNNGTQVNKFAQKHNKSEQISEIDVDFNCKNADIFIQRVLNNTPQRNMKNHPDYRLALTTKNINNEQCRTNLRICEKLQKTRKNRKKAISFVRNRAARTGMTSNNDNDECDEAKQQEVRLLKRKKRSQQLQKKYSNRIKLIKQFLLCNSKINGQAILNHTFKLSALYGDKQAKHYIGYTHLKQKKKLTVN